MKKSEDKEENPVIKLGVTRSRRKRWQTNERKNTSEEERREKKIEDNEDNRVN